MTPVGNGDGGGAPPAAPAGPSAPATVVEALEQRLAKYTEQRDKAKVSYGLRIELGVKLISVFFGVMKFLVVLTVMSAIHRHL